MVPLAPTVECALFRDQPLLATIGTNYGNHGADLAVPFHGRVLRFVHSEALSGTSRTRFVEPLLTRRPGERQDSPHLHEREFVWRHFRQTR